MKALPVFLVGLMTFGLSAAPAQAELIFKVRLLLFEGDPAPPTGDNFQTFDRPNISANGAVAYSADTDGDSSFDDVVYIDDVLVAREGDLAPGTEGTYSAFELFETGNQINASDQVVYIATLRDVPADANRAIYVGSVLAVREGDEAAGTGGALFEDFGFASIGDDGVVTFHGVLNSATTDDSTIYQGDQLIYRQGDVVVGTEFDGFTWDGDFDEVQANGAGQFVFEGNTNAPMNDQGIFGHRGNGLELLIRENAVVPARDGDDLVELFLQTCISDDGTWAIRGNLDAAPSTENAVIIVDGVLFAQEGEPVPGMPNVFTGNFNGLDINDGGDVLYLADLEGETGDGVDEALFINDQLLITDGVQAPGLPDGVTISDIGFEDLYINNDRTLVFQANTTSGDGLWLVDVFEGVDCDQVRKHKLKCRNGKLKSAIKTNLEQGTVLNVTRNGEDTVETTVNAKGKAKTKWRRQAGLQEVCLEQCDGFCQEADCG